LHDNLGNYFRTNFALMQHHKYSLTELEDMIPWERDIYVRMLMKWLKDEEQRQRSAQAQGKMAL
jgi:hypothetical protein